MEPLPPRRVVVGIPTNRPVDPRTMFSILRLFLDGKDRGLAIELLGKTNMYIDQARNELAADALRLRTYGATDLLLLDADMVWPADLIARLVTHDRPVVSGLYFQRRHPYDAVAYHLQPFRPIERWGRGLQPLYDGAIGLGGALIRLDVFERLADQLGHREWFQSNRQGEDIFFCNVLPLISEVPWLDADLEYGHLPCDVIVTSQLHHAARQQRLA